MTESRQVIAPASPEAIYLAMLAGHNADLATAQESLTLAGHFFQSADKVERGLVRPLVIDAVIAYGRCFQRSDAGGRKKLDEIVAIPDDLASTHEVLTLLRNKTVAHSENELTPSFAIANLERDGDDGNIRPSLVSAMAVHPAFSAEAIDEFRFLVGEVKRLLLEEIDRAKAALLAQVALEDAVSLWEDGKHPELRLVAMAELRIKSKRKSYPTTHIVDVIASGARTYLWPWNGPFFGNDPTGPED